MISPAEGELALTLRQIADQAALGNEPVLAHFAGQAMLSLNMDCGLCTKQSLPNSRFCQEHWAMHHQGFKKDA